MASPICTLCDQPRNLTPVPFSRSFDTEVLDHAWGMLGNKNFVCFRSSKNYSYYYVTQCKKYVHIYIHAGPKVLCRGCMRNVSISETLMDEIMEDVGRHEK